MGVTATVQCMTQFSLLLSCDSDLKSDWDFQLSGSGSNSLNWRKLPGRFSLPKGLGTRLMQIELEGMLHTTLCECSPCRCESVVEDSISRSIENFAVLAGTETGLS